MITQVIHKMSFGETFTTTLDDFEFFKKRCQHYLGQFGLLSWEVTIVHIAMEGDGYAYCQCDFIKRWGIISLNKTFNWPATRERLDRIAMHECAHMLLAPLSGLIAELRDGKLVTMAQAESAEEAVVRTLESVCFNGPTAAVAIGK